MHLITTTALCVLVAAPLVSLSAPARADNDFLGQAQRFLNNKGDDRDAYERGRQDEWRRQQAQRERRLRHHADEDWSRNEDRRRDDDYRRPEYGTR